MELVQIVEDKNKQKTANMNIENGIQMQQNIGKYVVIVAKKQKAQEKTIHMKMELVQIVESKNKKKNVNMNIKNGKQMTKNTGKYVVIVVKKQKEQEVNTLQKTEHVQNVD